MKVALVVAFYALVVILAFRIRRISLAVAAIGFTVLLAATLVVAATLDGTIGSYAAFGALIGVIGSVLALQLGFGSNGDMDVDV